MHGRRHVAGVSQREHTWLCYHGRPCETARAGVLQREHGPAHSHSGLRACPS